MLQAWFLWQSQAVPWVEADLEEAPALRDVVNSSQCLIGYYWLRPAVVLSWVYFCPPPRNLMQGT